MTDLQFDLPKEQSSIIKVIGVGGGGSNAVNHMYKQGIVGVNFVICNTDRQALEISPIPNKIQLGPDLTLGLGAGSEPEMGMRATEESMAEVNDLLSKNTKMVFVTAGMGGGTGTGGAPVVARLAKEMGILTVGIVTTPFSFEGGRKMKQAKEGIEKLKKSVDTVLVISNDKIREIHGDLSYKDAFGKADDVLANAAKSIAEIITVAGKVNVDFADVKYVMSDSGVAIMGSAVAEGQDRAIRAIETALASPLLNNNDIRGAKNILLNITSGSTEATIDEIDSINNYVQEAAGNGTDIIFGVCDDDSLGDKLSVTIIATGFSEQGKVDVVEQSEPQKIIVPLEEREIEEEKKSEEQKEIVDSVPQTSTLPLTEEKTEEKVTYSLDDEPALEDSWTIPEPELDKPAMEWDVEDKASDLKGEELELKTTEDELTSTHEIDQPITTEITDSVVTHEIENDEILQETTETEQWGTSHIDEDNITADASDDEMVLSERDQVEEEPESKMTEQATWYQEPEMEDEEDEEILQDSLLSTEEEEDTSLFADEQFESTDSDQLTDARYQSSEPMLDLSNNTELDQEQSTLEPMPFGSLANEEEQHSTEDPEEVVEETPLVTETEKIEEDDLANVQKSLADRVAEEELSNEEVTSQELSSNGEENDEAQLSDVQPTISNTTDNAEDEQVDQMMSQKAEERKKRLMGLSFSLRKIKGDKLDQISTEPAYLRKNVDLDEVEHSSEEQAPKYSLNEENNNLDEDGNPIITKNKFLHDNVD